MSWTKSALLLFMASGLIAGLAPVRADEAAVPPRPVIALTKTPTEPEKYGWLGDEASKGLASALAAYKKGTINAFVFAASPGGSYWSYRSTSDRKDLTSIEDLARRALQACEFFTITPCFIVSIDGFDALDAAGGLPRQPSMLAGQPIVFNPVLVPFVPASDWTSLEEYFKETKARAMVLTIDGSWWWATGDDTAGAVASAAADCKKDDADNKCILYAVNNRVVFSPTDPH